MTTIDANGSLHDPKGLFSNKDNTDAADGIIQPPPSPSARASLERQQWGGYDGDQAIEVGTDHFEVNVILDTMSLVEVEALLDMFNHEDRDRLYREAVTAGCVEEHDGPYAVFVNEWDIEDYLTYRRDNELTEPIRDDFPFSQKAQDEHIGRALRKAYAEINVTDLFAETTSDRPSVKEQFKKASNSLYWMWKGTQNVSDQFHDEDQAVFQRIAAVANRVGDAGRRDPEAQLAAVTLMEWLLKRDTVLAERAAAK